MATKSLFNLNLNILAFKSGEYIVLTINNENLVLSKKQARDVLDKISQVLYGQDVEGLYFRFRLVLEKNKRLKEKFCEYVKNQRQKNKT